MYSTNAFSHSVTIRTDSSKNTLIISLCIYLVCTPATLNIPSCNGLVEPCLDGTFYSTVTNQCQGIYTTMCVQNITSTVYPLPPIFDDLYYVLCPVSSVQLSGQCIKGSLHYRYGSKSDSMLRRILPK